VADRYATEITYQPRDAGNRETRRGHQVRPKAGLGNKIAKGFNTTDMSPEFCSL
jgi:hypothetical protein